MVRSNLTIVVLSRTQTVMSLKSSVSQTLLKKRVQTSQILGFTRVKRKTDMTKEDTNKLKSFLTSEMVSRITLAEAINIMHNLAVQEVEQNVEQMSEEEKASALEELQSKVESASVENTDGNLE
jgi:hypothetical protein